MSDPKPNKRGGVIPIGGIISIDQARAETKRWRDHHHIHDLRVKPGHTKAFFIPMFDLQCLLDYYKDLNPTGVRVYIGMKEENDSSCSPLRALLVPATETEDFWDAGCGQPGAVDESSIYDFTAPCPDTCASLNPLNGD